MRKKEQLIDQILREKAILSIVKKIINTAFFCSLLSTNSKAIYTTVLSTNNVFPNDSHSDDHRRSNFLNTSYPILSINAIRTSVLHTQEIQAVSRNKEGSTRIINNGIL